MPVASHPLRKLRELGLEIAPGQRCPYCHADVLESQRLVGCMACRVVLHTDCASGGRCTTLGCVHGPGPRPRPPRGRATRASRRRRPRGWLRPRWGRLLACALCFGVGFWACYTPLQPPVVVTRPAPPPPPPTPPRPIVADLQVPAAVEGDLLFVEGTVPPDVSWADVVIRSPAGQVELARQRPGRFLGVVGLPGPGLHRVVVEIVDDRGRRQVLEQVVRR